MFDKNLTLSDVDPDIANAINGEVERQEAHIELIASENYTSPAVMSAQGSHLPINMLKAILISVIMAVVSMLIKLKS